MSPQTIELLNTYNKAAKRCKRTRQEVHNGQWQLLQVQVSAAFDLDQQGHLDTPLAELEHANQMEWCNPQDQRGAA